MRYAELTPDLERELVARYQAGDRRAGDLLVAAHEEVLWEVVGKRVFAKQLLDDAMQNARLGFAVAARKIDMSRGFRLATYAAKWARGEALKAMNEDTTIVVKRHVTDEANGYERRGEAIPESIAMKMRLRTIESLEKPVSLRGSIDRVEMTLADTLASPEPTAEDLLSGETAEQKRRVVFERALSTLTAREQEVVRRSELADEPETLADIGRSVGLCRERVRQIHDRAIEKLQRAVRRVQTEDAIVYRARRQEAA
jgi:RNA polymerase sigma factor (sigma-70 family)